eukprot:scaffold11438_cov18-Tisochrysis_lutea.AAC.2
MAACQQKGGSSKVFFCTRRVERGACGGCAELGSKVWAYSSSGRIPRHATASTQDVAGACACMRADVHISVSVGHLRM